MVEFRAGDMVSTVTAMRGVNASVFPFSAIIRIITRLYKVIVLYALGATFLSRMYQSGAVVELSASPRSLVLRICVGASTLVFFDYCAFIGFCAYCRVGSLVALRLYCFLRWTYRRCSCGFRILRR